jgi:hypothetical protein
VRPPRTKPGWASRKSAVLVYGLLSAAFYCCLLPLWEGFDELYHYGYVQYVSTNKTFPVAGHTSLSRELWMSLDYVAISRHLQPHVERPSTSFEEYFRLTNAERNLRRRALDTLPRELQRAPSPRDNYEAKHAPLSYLLLAPLDRLLTGAPLTTRVLTLRLILSIAAIGLIWQGTHGLARRLGLSDAMETAAVFTIFSCQMLYGVVSHLANDALLLPWLLFFLSAVIDVCESPTPSRTGMAASFMALGLLIKASAMFLLPLLFAAPLLLVFQRRARYAAKLAAITAAIILALAGPWYARNIILYQNLTATNDSTSGVGGRQLWDAATKLPWRESVAAMAHNALWTGNSSFATFSAATIDVVLLLLALSAALYVARFRRSPAEAVTISAIMLYGAGLAVITLSFFSFSQGAITTAEPWYIPVLLAPVVLLCFLGLARWRRVGNWIAAATVLVWGYVAAATWMVKLVPLYGGFLDTHAHPRRLWSWYLEQGNLRDSILANLCPAPLPWLYGLFFAVLATLAIALIAALVPLIRADGFPLDERP